MKLEGDDRTDAILSILSKGAWCIEVLRIVARQCLCSKTDIIRTLNQGDIKHSHNPKHKTPLTEEVVDHCVTLLRTAGFIEQTGETVAITAQGSASAERLDSTNLSHIRRNGVPPAITKRRPSDALEPHVRPIKTNLFKTAIRKLYSKRTIGRNSDIQSSCHGAKALNEDKHKLRRLQSMDPHGSDSANALPHIKLNSETNSKHPVADKKYISLVVPILAIFIALGWNYVGARSSAVGERYRFADVRRGGFKISTIATGRIEAVDSVEVSSQLSGQVTRLYADFNDKVAAGAPLAQLDDETFKAAVAEAQARLAHAKASYDAAVAKIVGTEARYNAAQANYRRKDTLITHGGSSTQQLDKARADMATAKSELGAARADEKVQAAAVDEAKAALRKAQINLHRTIIRAPIAGTVIKRSVELGQTVAVSMKAPTLFTIARNLSHMRVHARVDEADIGRIRVGQSVRFSVDAYPDRDFTGRVIAIHHAPKIIQNVVTYTVVISAANRDLALLPGMTAIVHIITTNHPNALLVSDAAFRFHPDTKRSSSPYLAARDDQRRERHAAQVWVRTNSGSLRRTKIEIGKSNGNVTEVISGSLSGGELVAVGRRLMNNDKTLFGIRLGF